jgi:hypothetical protein
VLFIGGGKLLREVDPARIEAELGL